VFTGGRRDSGGREGKIKDGIPFPSNFQVMCGREDVWLLGGLFAMGRGGEWVREGVTVS